MNFSPRQVQLLNALIQLAVYCIKADGHVVHEEMEALQALLSRGFSDPNQRAEIRKLVLTGMVRSVNIDDAFSVLTREFPTKPDHVALVHVALGFVGADNNLDALEQAALSKICTALAITDDEFSTICRIAFKVNGNVNIARSEIDELGVENPNFSQVMNRLIKDYHSGDTFIKYGDELVGAIENRLLTIK